MVIAHLRLKDFRNYETAEIDFSDGLNIILGNNGQGKTSILEAIYFLCLSKSFKTPDDAAALRFERSFFEAEGKFCSLANGTQTVRVVFQRGEGKSVLIDKKRLDKFSELIGKFPVAISAPEDVAIVSGSPGERRRWMDIALSQMQAIYLKDLQDYRQVLRQRNALLNAEPQRLDSLDSWDVTLAIGGTRILKRRFEFVKEFRPLVRDVYAAIASDAETVDLEYKSTIAEIADADEPFIRDQFIKTLREGRMKECQRRTSLFGPHKDEVRFTINGVNIRDYGSQGQFKTFALALKLAEFLFLKERLEQTPILLLDDVFSELDRLRREQLLRYLDNAGQVFLTTAERTFDYSVEKPARFYTVVQGTVSGA